MNRLLYIGMDVHKESFTLSTYHVTLDENELTQDFIGDPLKITDATASGVEKYIKNLKKMLNIKATDVYAVSICHKISHQDCHDLSSKIA